MSLIEEYVPAAGYPNLKKIWWFNGIVFLVLSVSTVIIRGGVVFHLVAILFNFILISIILVTDRSAVRVTISSIDGKFTYITVDCFGKERETIVELLTANVSYKYTRLSKNTKGYRLRLYNNFFGNRITLKESLDNTGFTEEQLDAMVAFINKYREVPA